MPDTVSTMKAIRGNRDVMSVTLVELLEHSPGTRSKYRTRDFDDMYVTAEVDCLWFLFYILFHILIY